ncbi:hypothetical protein HNY73_007253 [Argiope bruennichi]|uniref:Uncharacterized protein n=1 Tax=Argiope bruennichi TaxID=94029 RepID=A0A8T0FIF8_ARGBR|nr:hypothetical protein HNY73_007253 [Argiope bruennichi]
MKQRNFSRILVVLALICASICAKELNGTVLNPDESSSRTPRKNHVYYNPPDGNNIGKKQQYTPEVSTKSEKSINFHPESDTVPEDTNPSFPLPLDYGKKPGFPKQKPHYDSPDRRMSKSGSNINWNIWNGDSSDSFEFEPPTSDMSDIIPLAKFENYHYPRGSWKDTPWNNARMAAMMKMLNDLQEPKPEEPEKSKPLGFISKITKDPSTFLLVAAIPVSILLSAVLPVLKENLNKFPTVSTIASSSKGRMFMDSFFAPVVDGVTTFGYRALENPGCTQKIFCQVTKGSLENDASPSFLQKVLYKASRFVDESYLDSYGVKTLINSMSDGNCENVPCTNFDLTDYILKLFSKKKRE